MLFLEAKLQRADDGLAWDGVDSLIDGYTEFEWELACPGTPAMYLKAVAEAGKFASMGLYRQARCCEWPVIEAYDFGKPAGRAQCEGCEETHPPTWLPVLFLVKDKDLEDSVVERLAGWFELEAGQNPIGSVLEAREYLDECRTLAEAQLAETLSVC